MNSVSKTNEHRNLIEAAFEHRASITPESVNDDISRAVEEEDIETAAKFDIEYVHVAMSAGMSEEDAKVLMEELQSWPKRVLGKISRFIATTMMGPMDELIEEPEKKAEGKK